MSDDYRNYITFYGINPVHWDFTFGSTTSYLLVRDYVSDAASTNSYTTWDACSPTKGEIRFLYPQNIKKKYYLEGVCQGSITFASISATSHVSTYCVSIVKLDSGNIETELASTGTRTVNADLPYDAVWHTGYDIVFPFWIDALTSGKFIDENERVGLKIEWDATSGATAVLMHDNDSQWEDVNIEMGFLL